MNLDIFKIIEPSGMLYREKFVSKHYTEEYNYIINYAIIYNLIELPFKEKVYLCISNLTSVPKCGNPKCNNITKFYSSTVGYRKCCSKNCIMKHPDVIYKQEINSLMKYGTKFPSQSPIIKEKQIKTNNERYGGNSAMCSKEIQQKATNTLMKNWGVAHTSQHPDLLQKRVQSFMNSDYIINFENNSIEKFGTKHPYMNDENFIKIYSNVYDEYKNRILEKIKNTNYIFTKLDIRPTILYFNCIECESEFIITPENFHSRIKNDLSDKLCTNCYPISDSSSLMQKDMKDFIEENYCDEILDNYNKIIPPSEIDAYLPDIKIGFEYNGLYWHCDEKKDKNYHLNKQNKAIENKINLYTIWQDDWKNKRDICKSFILNKLNKINNKIYARKCNINEISIDAVKEFIHNNSLEKHKNSNINLGLIYNNELVFILCFNENVLVNFCTKLNFICIGGITKLLNFFKNKFNYNFILTYSDNLITNGEIYEKLGFQLNSIIDINFCYVNKKQRIFTTEALEYPKIYDAGGKEWILRNFQK